MVISIIAASIATAFNAFVAAISYRSGDMTHAIFAAAFAGFCAGILVAVVMVRFTDRQKI